MKCLVILIIFFQTATTVAQMESSEDSIRSESPERVISVFFKAMRESDSTLLRSALHGDVRFITNVTDTSGHSVIIEESVEDFIAAVGTPKNRIWDERISGLEIRVDGNLAQAWMDYRFYLDDTFLHCGVNAMQLFFDGKRWLIFQIADTRRRADCY